MRHKKPPKTGIVKVQVSIFTGHQVQQTLIYNEDHTIWYQEDTTKELLKDMKGQLKQYYYYYLDSDGMIYLEKKAPNQDW